jgi:hypothetical protein
MRLACAGLAAVFGLLACGDNETAYEPWYLDELTPEQGVWVRTPEFEVPAGEETQDCYFFEIPATASDPLWIDTSSSRSTPAVTT